MKTLLLTGASVGLGLALSELLIETTDFHLVLTARKESLKRFSEAGITENERVWLRPLDVTVASQREELVNEINECLGGVDILVNNAGVAYRSVVEHVTERERLAQMDINFRSPMELARLVLPSMRAKRSGKIINVSSVGGMMAMPTMAVYSASKFALEGASESLFYEVKPWNISVTLVQPGFINSTSFQKVAYTTLSEKSHISPDKPYYYHYHYMDPFVAKWMGAAIATPQRVARKILKTALRKNPPLRVVATIDAHLFGLMRRYLPRRLYHWALYRSLPKIEEWGQNSIEVTNSRSRSPE